MSRRRNIPWKRIALVSGVVVATFVFWDTWLTWPVQLLVVFVHECGHALAAVLTGGEVLGLEIQGNLSGRAHTRGGVGFFVLQAGYLASALFGAALMLAAARPRSARHTLLVLAVALAGCGIAFTGSFFSPTLLFALLVATLFAWAARSAPEEAVRWGLVYLAVVSALYSLLDIREDLLRWEPAARSDATVMADWTGIPALVWGLLWAGLAVGVQALAIRRIFR